ncbi:THUMP domain-containing protein 2 [Protopterus annectens]|uniref:THUMP domain-containing protein 2 n=1 Tax=Protopterus annectens TaxID=7888 RepID=UPI001CFB1217|nr:THUMP domain-containing protein 2 [Protopterus annectens]
MEEIKTERERLNNITARKKKRTTDVDYTAQAVDLLCQLDENLIHNENRGINRTNGDEDLSFVTIDKIKLDKISKIELLVNVDVKSLYTVIPHGIEVEWVLYMLSKDIECTIGEVEYISGKVFFTTNAALSQLLKLKSAERLFLLLKKKPPCTVSRSKGKGLNDIQKYVIGEPSTWLKTVSIWQNINKHITEYEVAPHKRSECTKRKLVRMENAVPLCKRTKQGQTVDDILSVAPDKSQLQDSSENIVSKSIVERGGNCGQYTTDVSATGKLQDEKQSLDFLSTKQTVQFRVSCRNSGEIAKRFTAQDIGRIIGIMLTKQFGWKAELRSPDLEIFVHLNDIHCLVGIPLLRMPLASRRYIKTTGLRSTVAWAMAFLADIHANANVLDPMCGLGIILVEAAREWTDAYYLGIDIDESRLHGAMVNLKTAELEEKVNLLKASVTELPLQTESIDVIICDIPFGKKFKSSVDMREMLPHIINEMERVLCRDGTLVLLLSWELSRHIDECFCTSTTCSYKKLPDDISLASTMEEFELKEQHKDTENLSVQTSAITESSNCENKKHCSLVADGIYRVSLGMTDAFIHKYKKCSNKFIL